MFIEIIQIKRLQEDGTRTCYAKQWPTPPSLTAAMEIFMLNAAGKTRVP
jgi:hypothetical protein